MREGGRQPPHARSPRSSAARARGRARSRESGASFQNTRARRVLKTQTRTFRLRRKQSRRDNCRRRGRAASRWRAAGPRRAARTGRRRCARGCRKCRAPPGRRGASADARPGHRGARAEGAEAASVRGDSAGGRGEMQAGMARRPVQGFATARLPSPWTGHGTHARARDGWARATPRGPTRRPQTRAPRRGGTSHR